MGGGADTVELLQHLQQQTYLLFPEDGHVCFLEVVFVLSVSCLGSVVCLEVVCLDVCLEVVCLDVDGRVVVVRFKDVGAAVVVVRDVRDWDVRDVLDVRDETFPP